jgi:hypothetical protein
MKRTALKIAFAVGVAVSAASAAAAAVAALSASNCGPDAVQAGTICLDRYEASVWRVPDPTATNANLVKRIRLGSASRADLTAGGATQLGTVRDDYAPCTNDGQNCADDIYAVSLPSEFPAAHITWFQAQEACANAGKRLPTSAEWQVGANGTPDPGPDNGTTDCNTAAVSASRTGARRSCVSTRGAFDMVGNMYEWVADWVPLSASCLTWGGFSNDDMCLAGANENPHGPGALLRGGNFISGPLAGPLAVEGGSEPSFTAAGFGFRCVRESPRVLTGVGLRQTTVTFAKKGVLP